MNDPGVVESGLGREILWGGVGALGAGVVASMLVAVTASDGPYWSDGVLLSAYLLAACAVASLFGLIFAIPRARTDTAPTASGRFVSNSNLEQISDWLTKILVGAGLVQLRSLPGGLASLGDYLGGDLTLPSGPAASVALTVYGAGVGFMFAYLWSRLRLRVLFEASEKQAEEQARTQIRVATSLAAAASKQGLDESTASIEAAAATATAVAMRSSAVLRRVLWVDDEPQNNVSERQALAELGVAVRQVASTEEALAVLAAEPFGLVITDLGRVENGARNDEAGLDLIRAIKPPQPTPPIFVYGGTRAYARRAELMQAGARDVFNRASTLVSSVVQELAR